MKTKFYDVTVSFVIEACEEGEAYEEVQRILEMNSLWDSKVSELEIHWPIFLEEV